MQSDLRKENNMEGIFIGIVENGKFKLLFPKPDLQGEVRLTSIDIQEARSPESGELDLTEYEGCAIAVQGHDGGGWIYTVSVIDTGGAIITAMVQQIFKT